MEATTILRAKDVAQIRKLAEDLDLGPTKFGRAAGVSPQRIWKLYYGEARITASSAISIANVLHQPVNELFELPDADELHQLGLI